MLLSVFNNGEEAKIADAQNNWTEIRFENIDTKTKKTTVSSALNGGNIGVQFEISKVKTVKPAVMADGESTTQNQLCLLPMEKAGSILENGKSLPDQNFSNLSEPQDTGKSFGPNPKFNNTNLNQLQIY